MATETVAVQARTSLEAMNSILALVGNSPVTDYNATNNLDVVLVRQVIEETSAEVQEDAWLFNQEIDYEMELDGSNEIVLATVFTETGYTPEYIARIDFNACKNQGRDLIVRSGKVYDRKEHTYTMTNKAYADIVWYMPWADLPNEIRYYITIRAARKFASRRLGSELVDGMLREQEGVAYTRARGAEMSKGDYNALKKSRVLWR